MENEPRDVAYDKSMEAIYEKLKNDPLSPFFKKQYADIFLYAMALGFKLGRHSTIKDRRPNIPVTALGDSGKWLCKSIAIFESKKLDVLLGKDVYKPAEEYANTGIKHLDNLIFGGGFGRPENNLISDLKESAKRK